MTASCNLQKIPLLPNTDYAVQSNNERIAIFIFKFSQIIRICFQTVTRRIHPLGHWHSIYAASAHGGIVAVE